MNKEIMNVIRDEEFGGERPLFASKGLRLEGVTVHAGESALKCCSDVVAEGCRFEGKYPFWHVDGFEISLCLFTPGARAALWYSRNLVMTDTLVGESFADTCEDSGCAGDSVALPRGEAA